MPYVSDIERRLLVGMQGSLETLQELIEHQPIDSQRLKLRRPEVSELGRPHDRFVAPRRAVKEFITGCARKTKAIIAMTTSPAIQIF